jgi:hypothetical protein
MNGSSDRRQQDNQRRAKQWYHGRATGCCGNRWAVLRSPVAARRFPAYCAATEQRGSPQSNMLICVHVTYLETSKAIPATDSGGLQGWEMLRIPHCLDQWFPKCAPRRPWEPRLPHRGAAKYYIIFIFSSMSLDATSRGPGAKHLATVCRSLCKWPVSKIASTEYCYDQVRWSFEVFFLVRPFKRDRVLLDSNKRCESENKEGTSSANGKSVKKRKIENMMTAIWTSVLHRQKSLAKRDRNVFCVWKFWHQSACYQVSRNAI